MQIFPVFGLVALVFFAHCNCAFWSEEGYQSDRAAKRKNGIRDDGASTRPNIKCATDRRTCANYHQGVQDMLNTQINEELKASYVYQAMSFYYARDDVALPGFSKFFHDASAEEKEHAEKLMNYQVKRGGKLELFDITKPEKDEWRNGLEAIQDALQLEHVVNNKLLDLHWLSQQQNDAHLQDFLEGEFLTEQVDSIKKLADIVTILERMRDNPLGEYLFDKQLSESK